MECPLPQTECVHIDITVNPTSLPPKPPEGPNIPPKLLAIMRKYKYNWRLAQLAKPKLLTKKFVPIPPEFVPPQKLPSKLTEEKKYYADQMSKPKLRCLYLNRGLYAVQNKKLRKIFNKNINKTWETIYNYYKKNERLRKLRQLRHKKTTKETKHVIDEKKMAILATPKPVFKPEPIKKSSKLFSNFGRLDEIATPKPSFMPPPKRLGVNPAALTYEATENIIKLSQLPPRFLNVQPPLEPGKVKRSALKYKATPRIEEIAQPKQRSEKAKEDEDYNPWAISKNALKYKPTPRILELAKPIERE